jgi:hypothetical protein
VLSNKLREKLNAKLRGEPTRPRIAACDGVRLRFVQFPDALIAILEQSFLLACAEHAFDMNGGKR